MDGNPLRQDLQPDPLVQPNDEAMKNKAMLQNLVNIFMEISAAKANENEGRLPPASQQREENEFGHKNEGQGYLMPPIGHGAPNRTHPLYPPPPGCADFEADCVSTILPTMKGINLPGPKPIDWSYDGGYSAPARPIMPRKLNFQHSLDNFKQTEFEHNPGIPAFRDMASIGMNGHKFHGQRFAPNNMTNFWNVVEKPQPTKRPIMENLKEPKENYDELMDNLKRLGSRLPMYKAWKPKPDVPRPPPPVPVIMPREFQPPFPKPIDYQFPPTMLPDFMESYVPYPTHPNDGYHHRYMAHSQAQAKAHAQAQVHAQAQARAHAKAQAHAQAQAQYYNRNYPVTLADLYAESLAVAKYQCQLNKQGPSMTGPMIHQSENAIKKPVPHWLDTKYQSPRDTQKSPPSLPSVAQEPPLRALKINIDVEGPFYMFTNDSEHNIFKAMIDSGILPDVPVESVQQQDQVELKTSQGTIPEVAIESTLQEKLEPEQVATESQIQDQQELKISPEPAKKVQPASKDFQFPKKIQEKHTSENSQPENSKTTPGRKYWCAFCKKNGEPTSVYLAHSLYDPISNDVICPYLSKYRCKICAATGARAHTESYCLFNRKSAKTPPQLNLADSLVKCKMNKFKVRKLKSRRTGKSK